MAGRGALCPGPVHPAPTTCVAACLADSLPVAHLNVAMGAYVSAMLAGGLGGGLLAGYLHPPLHWRHAFVSAAVLLILATLAAARWLPGVMARPRHRDGAPGSGRCWLPGPHSDG